MSAVREMIDEARALDKAATDGPWATHPDDPRTIVSVHEPDMSLLGRDKDDWAIVVRKEDAAFIAFARTALPKLVEAVERAEAERDAARLLNDKIQCAYCGWTARKDDAGAMVAHMGECSARVDAYEAQLRAYEAKIEAMSAVVEAALACRNREPWCIAGEGSECGSCDACRLQAACDKYEAISRLSVSPATGGEVER